MADDPQQQISQLIARVNSLTGQLTQAQALQTQTAGQLVQARTQIDTVQRQLIAEQQGRVQDQITASANASALQGQITTIKADRDTAVANYTTISAQLTVLTNTNAGLTSQIDEMQRSIATTAQQLTAVTNALVKTKADYDAAVVNSDKISATLDETKTLLDAEKTTHAATTVALATTTTNLNTAMSNMLKAQNDRAAFAAKFDALYGPVEDGIVLGPAPYITVDDNAVHATLEAARIHRIARAGNMSEIQAKMLVKNFATARTVEAKLNPTKPPAP